MFLSRSTIHFEGMFNCHVLITGCDVPFISPWHLKFHVMVQMISPDNHHKQIPWKYLHVINHSRLESEIHPKKRAVGVFFCLPRLAVYLCYVLLSTISLTKETRRETGGFQLRQNGGKFFTKFVGYFALFVGSNKKPNPIPAFTLLQQGTTTARVRYCGTPCFQYCSWIRDTAAF